jgi:hypothetical protein
LGPIAAVAGVLLLAAGAAFAVRGAFGDDEPAASAENAPDRANEDAGTEPALDQPGDGTAGICIEGTVDCDDTVVDPDGEAVSDPAKPDEPVTNDPGLIAPDECGLAENAGRCQEKVVATVREDLVSRVGAEPDLVTVEYVEWPDASLGNPEPGMAYAQVITPGFKIVFEAGGAPYEYHTDLAGNFTLLE